MMLRNKNIILVFIFLLFASYCYAKEVLTLEKCIKLALTNNHLIRITEKKLAEAKAKKQEAFGHYLPNLTLSGSYTRMSDAPGLAMAAPLYTPVEVEDIKTGVPVPTQGLLVTGYEEFEYSMGQEENYVGQLTLTQPIFTWGKIYQGNKQARLNYELTEQEYRRVKNEVIFNVKQSFYSILLAKEFLKIAEEAVDVMQKHYNVTKSFYKEGMVSNVDVSRVKVQLVNAKTRRIKARNGLKLAKKMLFNIINLPEQKNMKIQGKLKYKPQKLNLKNLFESAEENRPEIKQIDIQKNMTKSFLRLAQAENRPNLSFMANYQYQKPYYFLNEWSQNWSATVALNFPLFNGLSNCGKIKQAKAQIDQVEISKEQLEKGIKLEVEKAYFDLFEAKERIGAQKTNVKSARENLKSIQKRYKKGLVSDLDLRDTQLALTQAETEYSQALFDYNVALASLEKAIGK